MLRNKRKIPLTRNSNNYLKMVFICMTIKTKHNQVLSLDIQTFSYYGSCIQTRSDWNENKQPFLGSIIFCLNIKYCLYISIVHITTKLHPTIIVHMEDEDVVGQVEENLMPMKISKTIQNISTKGISKWIGNHLTYK